MTQKEIAEIHTKVAEYIGRHPEMTFMSMSHELGISLPHISRIAIKHGLRRRAANRGFEVNSDLLAKLEK